MGIKLFEKEQTKAIDVSSVSSIDDIIERIGSPNLILHRAIFVGEQHDKFEHHLNQLMVIKKLHEHGYKVAIGMEMFQQKLQTVLKRLSQCYMISMMI